MYVWYRVCLVCGRCEGLGKGVGRHILGIYVSYIIWVMEVCVCMNMWRGLCV